MGIFDKLKVTFSSGKLKKEQLEKLRETIWNVVTDGEVTDRELEVINKLYSESELSQEDLQKLRNEVFTQIVHQAISDRRVTESELRSLNHLIERLEISPEIESWAEKQIGYYRLFTLIESGESLPQGSPIGLILQKNEVCHLSLPAQLLEERVVSRNYSGGSRGVNVRLIKGVSFKVGQNRGQMVSQTGLVIISEGYFIITNKRLVFSGDRKSVSTAIEKLLDLNVFSNGLSFSATNRQKPTIIQLSVSEEAELCALIISRLINE